MKLAKEAQVVGGWEWEHFRRCADRASHKIIGRQACVTAGYNGKHMKNSYHYIGQAFDLRVWFDADVYTGRWDNATCENYAIELRLQLGDCWDVVVHYAKFEDATEYVTHIHCELDLS